jgi:putative membrane protein insertion efficiency factor
VHLIARRSSAADTRNTKRLNVIECRAVRHSSQMLQIRSDACLFLVCLPVTTSAKPVSKMPVTTSAKPVSKIQFSNLNRRWANRVKVCWTCERTDVYAFATLWQGLRRGPSAGHGANVGMILGCRSTRCTVLQVNVCVPGRPQTQRQCRQVQSCCLKCLLTSGFQSGSHGHDSVSHLAQGPQGGSAGCNWSHAAQLVADAPQGASLPRHPVRHRAASSHTYLSCSASDQHTSGGRCQATMTSPYDSANLAGARQHILSLAGPLLAGRAHSDSAESDGLSAEEDVEDSSSPDGDRQSRGVAAALAVLRFYKRQISPILPPSCRFIPTCSEYAMEAYQEQGFGKGTVLTAWRLLRCNPFGALRDHARSACISVGAFMTVGVFMTAGAPVRAC